MMSILARAAVFVLLLSANNSISGEIKLVSVVDGDTLQLNNNGKIGYYSLYGVDAPENGQPFSEESKNFVKDNLIRLPFRIAISDSYDPSRKSVIIFIKENNSEKDFSCALIYKGFAFHDRRIKSNNTKYISSENMAKKSKLGVWSQNKIEYPWDYRNRLNITEEEVAETLREQERLIKITARASKSSGVQDDNQNPNKRESLTASCRRLSMILSEADGYLNNALSADSLGSARRYADMADSIINNAAIVASECNCDPLQSHLSITSEHTNEAKNASSLASCQSAIAEAYNDKFNYVYDDFELCFK